MWIVSKTIPEGCEDRWVFISTSSSLNSCVNIITVYTFTENIFHCNGASEFALK